MPADHPRRTAPYTPSYALLGPDGHTYPSPIPGTLGGHRGGRIYGRLDCRTALRAIANGGYTPDRVFFADETTAVAAGYRPCAVCLPEHHVTWQCLRDAASDSAGPGTGGRGSDGVHRGQQTPRPVRPAR